MAPRSSVREAVAAIERLCGSGPIDSREFRAAVIEVLRRVIGFDWFVWVLTDPVTEVGVDPLAVAPDLGEVPRLVRLKYLTTVNRWTQLRGVANLADRRDDSLLWTGAQSRHGVSDVASVVFRDAFGCWAFLDLWSTRTFPAAALDLLAELAPGLTTALRRRQARTFADVEDPGATHTEAAVLLLDNDLRITSRTPTSQAWLTQLLPPGPGADPVPAAALNVAAQLLAREAGVDDHPAAARVHLDRGVWLKLRAARLTPNDLIAISLDAATPGDRLDLFARCHALSPRETELLNLLAQGGATKDVAARMFLSEHTVQDHLKLIFVKTGTHSRRSLLSHALGVKAGPAAATR